MIKISDKLNKKIDIYPLTGFRNSDAVFFDIETTGFAANTTSVYLIGCVYYQNSSWQSISWFAETPAHELEVISNFFDFISNYKAIIHFNGDGFDIPYLLKKVNMYNLPYNFENKTSIDIYKKISPLKHILKLGNLKQKSIEKFLGINRNDKFNGGELISIYNHYVASPNLYDYNNLILHNKEDIAGLLNILPILSYSAICSKDFEVRGNCLSVEHIDPTYEPKTLFIGLKFNSPFPKSLSYSHEEFTISTMSNNNLAQISIKVYSDELKYFFPNYKDYYYLPYEDAAIHKSVAFYVDKDFRTRAKAANCYSKKTGRFAPEYDEIIKPYFKIDYYDKKCYFELTDEVLNDGEIMTKYAHHIIDILLKK